MISLIQSLWYQYDYFKIRINQEFKDISIYSVVNLKDNHYIIPVKVKIKPYRKLLDTGKYVFGVSIVLKVRENHKLSKYMQTLSYEQRKSKRLFSLSSIFINPDKSQYIESISLLGNYRYIYQIDYHIKAIKDHDTYKVSGIAIGELINRVYESIKEQINIDDVM